MNSFIEELFQLEHVETSTKQLCTILGANYKKEDLKKVMKNQCQNLIEEQYNE